MTRINTVPVDELTDQHLMAEYRELPMINASLARSKKSKKGVHGIPHQYTLNSGHVKFFYNKGKFLLMRYNSLCEELRVRGYNIDPASRSVDWDVFDEGLFNDWTPKARDHSINVQRLVERLNSKVDWYRYKGDNISSKFVQQLRQRYGVHGNI